MKVFKNIRDIVFYATEKFASRPAFKLKRYVNNEPVYENVTYTRFRQEIDNLAKYFLKRGSEAERIAVIGDNNYRWMVVFCAALSAGKIIVPLDKGLFADEIADQLSRSNADMLFYSESIDAKLSKIDSVEKFCTDSEQYDEALRIGKTAGNEAEYANVVIDNDRMSILLFTSGTTSKSKAVMLSQRNIASNVYALNLHEKFYPEDTSLALLPFHHAFGLVQTILFISVGICTCFCEGLRVATALEEYGISILVGVPRVADMMKSAVDRKIEEMGKTGLINKAMKISSVLGKVGIDVRRKLFKSIIDGLGGKMRFIIVGAAPANPDTLDWFNNVGILTVQGYGLSECSPVVSAENDTHMRRGSIGTALPGVDVRIDSPDENDIGEIVVKGENVMLGYLDNPEETAKVLKDGELYTGDMGYMDQDGYIFITGRKKNVIVLDNGKNVFPEELEGLMANCSVVKECIVSNAPENGKDLLVAKVYTEKGTDLAKAQKIAEEFASEINKKLPQYKWIKKIEVTDVQPEMTTTLKVKRHGSNAQHG